MHGSCVFVNSPINMAQVLSVNELFSLCALLSISVCIPRGAAWHVDVLVFRPQLIFSVSNFSVAVIFLFYYFFIFSCGLNNSITFFWMRMGRGESIASSQYIVLTSCLNWLSSQFSFTLPKAWSYQMYLQILLIALLEPQCGLQLSCRLNSEGSQLLKQ